MNDTTNEIVVTLVAADGFDLSSLFHSGRNDVWGQASKVLWLADKHAVDLFYTTQQNIMTLRCAVQATLATHPVDCFVQPVATRKKRLFVADMESTIIQQEMLDELAEFVGARDKTEEITRRAMNGELDFAASLRERVSLLKGQPSSLLDEVAQRITPMKGAENFLRALKQARITCWLVSGGFTCFADSVGKRLGFDRVFANQLVVTNDIITGEVVIPILDKAAKKRLLEQACDELHIGLSASITIGDGANDIPMLETCNSGGGFGVAYHAKPKVREAIVNQINYTDLGALVYAMGLARQI